MEYNRLTKMSEITGTPTLKAMCESCGEDGCGEFCEEYQEKLCKGCPVQEAFQRLSDYEDSGLSPDQVKSNSITSITVTPHVKELLDLLEPDTKLEALSDNGRAVITYTGIKLNVLLHTVHKYMNEGAISINELRRVYDRVSSTELSDLANYINDLETTAEEMTNACIEWWRVSKEKPEYKRFTDAVFRMKAILGDTDATRRTKEE